MGPLQGKGALALQSGPFYKNKGPLTRKGRLYGTRLKLLYPPKMGFTKIFSHKDVAVRTG